MRILLRVIIGSLITVALVGCATFTAQKYNQLYGSEAVVDRQVGEIAASEVDYWVDVQPILESRCVSCHACYDAPCQLKATAVEGLDRGAKNLKVYDVRRLTPAQPSRLFEDHFSTEAWRKDGFYPVLNEHATQSKQANLDASLLYRFLELKRQNPLPTGSKLPKEITLDIQRKEQCTDIQSFDSFALKNPLWGMPYGLPQLSESEHETLKKWIEQGARYTARPPLEAAFKERIANWEVFLNQDSLKAQLVSRYIYEHLYLGNLYFDDLSDRQFFKLVRSATPPGVPVQQIATRRPYSDPKVDRVYYRLVEQKETIVAKTHKPFALNQARKEKWQALFFEPDYSVTELPSYKPKVAGNPFISFAQLPMNSRYRFLLDEAHFIIQNFVKGTVCRGQVAVNVIRDRFWVFFIDPDLPVNDLVEEAIIQSQADLELSSAQEDIYLPLTNWVRYASKERKARKNRDTFLAQAAENGQLEISLENIWDGDGVNPNAALTVFRHFDYGTVEQGLLGDTPQTAWVISYPLLERIYYLLVAGYDVYGNVGHQLLSRVHMDFLRMDGEASFLTMLPEESRGSERNSWHRGAPKEANEFLANPKFERAAVNTIPFTTQDPKNELLMMLKDRLTPVLKSPLVLDLQHQNELNSSLNALAQFNGEPARLLPEISVVKFVDQAGNDRFVTIVKDLVHLNMSSMFNEEARIAADETRITLLDGIAGAYPNAFFTVPAGEAEVFIQQVRQMQSETDYEQLVDRFGVRRTDDIFWAVNDSVHAGLKAQSSVKYGVLDLSRYENR